MTLETRIDDDWKTAMKAGEKARKEALSLLRAAIKQKRVDEQVDIDDAAVIAVIEKMLKQRKDSITQYEAAKRQDLADVEKFESSVLATYMPQGLSAAEIEAIVSAAVIESGAKAPSDMGKVIALVKPQVAGRADMGEVSKLVKARLSAAV
ncbi:MAG: GatB/YqeY domain-containing protein [Burkholderiaceae bacterium]|nr:GatB/YqeY domain-containing protein [Sulfuritalea sp.]MCF8174010.1 GatB/YqeY domain-containing protein [Burkholderiaceae bacterium]